MYPVTEARNRISDLAGEERVITGGSLVSKDGRFGFGNDLFESTPSFEFKLCEMIKVPQGLYRRCSDSLKGQILAEFASGEDRFGVVVRKDKADALIRSQDLFIPALSVVDKIVEVMGDKATFGQIGLNKGVFDLEVLSSEVTAEPRKGDISRGGVAVRFGQFEGINYRVSVGSFIYRLVCQNGLMRRESENHFVLKRLRLQEEALNQIGMLVTQTVESVQNLYMKEYAESVNVPVIDSTSILRVIAKEMGVPAELVEGLLDLIPTLPEKPTYYDLTNLVTTYANQHEWARRRLLYTGGRIVDQSVVRCSACHRALAVS